MLITPAEERMHGVGRQGAGWTPQACELPRPQCCTNESKGSGWAHTGGARDYRPCPKGARERILRIKGDQEGRLQSFCKQKSDNPCYVLVIDIHYLEYLSKCACRYMYILHILCIYVDIKRPSQSGDSSYE